MSVPYAPMNVVLQTGNSKNFLLWDLVIGATSYSVQRSTDGLTYSTIGTSAGPNYLDSAVSVGTSYYYQVAAVNVSGTSNYTTSYPTNITPCLPGQINLGYLRYLAQLRADKLNSQYLTVDEWNSNINQSMYELYDILVTKFGDDYFLAPSLHYSLTGADSYPLPDGSSTFVNALGQTAPAMYKLNGVDVNVGGASTGPSAGWQPVPRSNWSDRDKYTVYPGGAFTINGLFEISYRPMGNQLFIYPANTTQVIRIWYVPVMTQLLQDSDMLPFSISGWSEYIIIDAAMKAMIKEESLEKWQALAQNKAMQIERIETTAANRDVGQPNSVSNTRATMGDPGFSNWGNGYGGGSSGSFGY